MRFRYKRILNCSFFSRSTCIKIGDLARWRSDAPACGTLTEAVSSAGAALSSWGACSFSLRSAGTAAGAAVEVPSGLESDMALEQSKTTQCWHLGPLLL